MGTQTAPVSVVHTGDTHIGYSQYNRQQRKQDFTDAFASVIGSAIDHTVDAVVHAGDLFDTSRPDSESIMSVASQLQRLATNDIPFLTIVGNHDRTRNTTWPAVFESLDLATALDRDGVAIGNTTFFGLDYLPETQRTSDAYQFTQSDTEYAALVAHGQFYPVIETGGWDLRTVLRKSPVAFDICLLGDDHTRRVTEITENNIQATYAGSTERTAADQRVPRSHNLVRFADTIDTKPIQHPARTFIYIDVELDADSDTETVLDVVRSHTIPNQSVVVVTLTGSGDRVKAAPVADLAQSRGALTVRVNDRRSHTDKTTDTSTAEPVNVEEAVTEQVPQTELSDIMNEFDTLARSPDLEAKTNLADQVETRVTDALTELVEDEPDASALPTTGDDTQL